ncbi:ankyrin [Vigna unguiculata]|uniref:Ankyrin n=1 Tax=Vigna unguiculata TaxID=3917 RepID=A0A4D6LD93_VIGUN|nr:ankyrin [Vigna unguiculata]
MQSVYWMEFAARQGDVNSLYEIIENDPCVLEAIDSIPFIESPLHVAARAGQVQFAAEIMTLKPSFAWKFNPQGLRPIHLALENGDTTMILHLIKMDKELVRAKRREGLTLLHLASESGDIDLLTELLKACPDSVKDLTVRNETALHFAVMYRRLDALRFLLRWLKTNTVKFQDILNQKDVDGNTILHIAATNNDTEEGKFAKINVCPCTDRLQRTSGSATADVL